MIEVEHVTKRFGSFLAVNDINFSIETGEIIGLLGPNGAGKTTTMRMISGFFEPTSGSIKIDGLDVVENGVETRKKIGYMPESAPLYSDMIVYDYLKYVAEIQNQNGEEKIRILAEQCGLNEVMHKKIGELSRGNRQRVGLAHALMGDPEILILDEPTSGLDPNQVQSVRSLIKEIGKTRTVIVSTHILSEVEAICSRVIIISEGKKVADASPEELKNLVAKNCQVHLVLGKCGGEEAMSLLEKFGNTSVRQEGERVVLDIALAEDNSVGPEIARSVVQKGWDMFEMKLTRNSLEDVFRSVTTGGSEK